MDQASVSYGAPKKNNPRKKPVQKSKPKPSKPTPKPTTPKPSKPKPPARIITRTDSLANTQERKTLRNRATPHHKQKNGVYVLGKSFTKKGRVTDFAIFDDDKQRVDQFITPLILRPVESRWRVVAMGEAVRSDASGFQRFPFLSTSGGGSPLVEPGDRFGWRDGEIGFDSTGLIDYADNAKAREVIYLGNRHASFPVKAEFPVASKHQRIYSIVAHLEPASKPDAYRNRLRIVLGHRYERLLKHAAKDGRARAELENMKADPLQMAYIERFKLDRRAERAFDRAGFYMKSGNLEQSSNYLTKVVKEYRRSSYAEDARFLLDLIEKNDKVTKWNESQILAWVDEHQRLYDNWPTKDSGPKWREIDAALLMGLRGMKSGSSLAELLSRQRGVKLAD